MNWTFAGGAVLTLGGLVGYAVGTQAEYPGRAFAITGFMVGITLLAVSGGSEQGGVV